MSIYKFELLILYKLLLIINKLIIILVCIYNYRLTKDDIKLIISK